MGILFFIVFILVLIAVYLVYCDRAAKKLEKKQKEKAEAEKERKEQEALEAIENARRLVLLMEVKHQAELVGDKATVDAVMGMTYNGKMPELRDDGAYLSLYDNLRIFKIAGMKYRGNLSAYIGDFKGMLVPEPKNEYDPMAIMVKCEDGKHLGYIKEGQTDMVRWLVGAEQPLGESTPTEFKPYRITGVIEEKSDEIDGHKFYDGCIYVVKKEN